MTHLTRQRISRCLTKSACATRVKYDSSRNSVFVLGRLFLVFFLVGFAQVSMTLMKLKGGQQRRLQSGSAVLRLQAKRPGAQMAFMTIMGWRHIQWKSNLSSYRKKKKKSIWMWVCSQHETVWINNGNGPVTKESAGASSRCQGRISSPSWPLEGGKNNRL